MAEHGKLSRQEELFCGLYALLGNPAEAAAQAGYPRQNALRAAARLLGRANVREEAARRAAEERNRDRDRALAGLLRLALGGGGDTAHLPGEELAGVDCYQISELRRPRDGALEIKLTDRLKAFELLLGHIGGERDAETHSLYGALEKGAAALSGLSAGQECEGDEV